MSRDGRSSAAHISRLSTHWDELIRAHGEPGDEATAARRALLGRYIGAVFRYLLAVAHDDAVAEELSQEFALRFLRGDFKNADPGRGRFRNYLKTALFRLVAEYRRGERARPAPLTADSRQAPAAAADLADPDGAFETEWRGELLARAWEALAEAEARDGHLYHTVLRWRSEHPDVPAQVLAEELSVRLSRPMQDTAVRQMLHRAREKFAILLRAEVAASLATDDPTRLEEELIALGLLPYCHPAGTGAN
jgi:DNA-directed RNA polymerase specialized sigma24 family protein